MTTSRSLIVFDGNWSNKGTGVLEKECFVILYRVSCASLSAACLSPSCAAASSHLFALAEPQMLRTEHVSKSQVASFVCSIKTWETWTWSVHKCKCDVKSIYAIPWNIIVLGVLPGVWHSQYHLALHGPARVPTAEINNEHEYLRNLNKFHLSEFIVGLLQFFKKLQSSVTVEIPHP